MRSVDRRQAGQQLLAAAAALGGIVQIESRVRAQSPLNRLRIGGIGVGNRGFDNLLAVANEEIVALCDVDARYLDKARQQFPAADTYRDYREMLAHAALDAVIISTPDHSHALPAQLALERGWHVYCEKPLARSIDEVRAMAAAATKSSAVTQMGNQHHAAAGYQQAIDWLRGGILGRVSEVHCWTDRPIWPQGVERPSDRPPVPEYLDWKLWLGSAPERPYHPAYHPLQWRGWWDFGTGALGDMGPHLLDPLVAGLSLGLPQRVAAIDCQAGAEGPPVASTLRFEFATNDEPLVLHWYDGGRKPDPEVAAAKRLPPNGSVVIGTDGRMFIPELGRMPLLIGKNGQRESHAAPDTKPRPTHHAEWLAACKGSGSPRSPFAYGARLTEICLLGNAEMRKSG